MKLSPDDAAASSVPPRADEGPAAPSFPGTPGRRPPEDSPMSQRPTLTDDLVIPFHCDRCGALAKVRVVLASGSDLVFCGHHAREYETKLRDIAVDIIDTDGEQHVTA
jgi:hypothetical protein